MRKPVLVIGYGNPLRGDDGIGWEVARRLQAHAEDLSFLILTVQQLTPDLAEEIHHAELAVFVDASDGNEPGTWQSERIVPAENHAAALGHHSTPTGLLAFTRGLFDACPEANLVSVAAKSFACGEKLSPEVEAVLPAVVDHVCRLVARPN